MNKNCYRIVFNRARGQLMAVAETACTSAAGCVGASSATDRPGGGAARQGRIALRCRPLVLALWLGLGASAQVAAQIIADPTAPSNQRPTVLTDGHGRPMVNIQTPSAAGVSRNTYRQFDVQSNGAVLNNSRASNPWLATGEARVILNEVNSSNPSLLSGQVAVNGGSAQVVIANPSGLKIDGASFVNASRVTLTTGTADVQAGELRGLRVDRGLVEITGAGLDVRSVPFTEVISRAAALSAQLQGGVTGQVSVVTGTQTLNYATGSTTAMSATTPAPSLAIDASALGSMYAGRITLLATEAGVGVRNAAALRAASQLMITADGQLTHTGTLAAPVVSLATVSGDIALSGPLQADAAALLAAGGSAHVSGRGLVQSAGSAVVLNAQKNIELAAHAAVRSTATGGRVTLHAQEAIALATGSSVAAQAGVSLTAQGQVRVTGAQLSSEGGQVMAVAGQSLRMDSAQINASRIHLETGQALAETRSPVALHSNQLRATDSLTVLATGDLQASGNQMTATNHLHLGASHSMTLSADQLRAGSLELIGRSMSASGLHAAASSGALSVRSSAGALDIRGISSQASSLSAATDLQVTALGGDARLQGVQASADHIRVNATGDTMLQSGRFWDRWWGSHDMATRLVARGSLSVATVGEGRTLDLGNSTLSAGTQNLSLVSAGTLGWGTAAVSSAQASVSAVSAGTMAGLGDGTLRAGQSLSVDVGRGNLVLTPSQAWRLSAGQDLSLTARNGLLALQGQGGGSTQGASVAAWSVRDLSLQGATVDVQGARLSASRDLSITSTAGHVVLSPVQNLVDESGYRNTYVQAVELSAGRNLRVASAGDLLGEGLRATAGADLRMQALSRLELTGTANRTTGFDGFWTIERRDVNASELRAGGAMALSAGSDLLLDAVRARAGGDLTITALGNVNLDASQHWVEHTAVTSRRSKRRTTVTHHLRENLNTAPTQLEGGSIRVSAGQDLQTQASRLQSGGRVELQAGGASRYHAVWDRVHQRDETTRTSRFLGVRYARSSHSSSRMENTPLATRLQSEAELVSHSGGDTLLQGTQVRAGGGYRFDAGVGERARADARIILEGVRSTVQQSRTKTSELFSSSPIGGFAVWQSQSGSGSETQTLALPSFAGGGTFTAPGGLALQILEGDFRSQIQSLTTQPGMGYLNELVARRDVNWQPVKLAHEQWNYSQSGLTPNGAALLAVAVAVATGGAGASLIGGTVTTTTAAGATVTTTTTAGLMANAAFSSLAAQASIALVNNQGDVGKTLKELGNSHTAKATLAAMLTAGVMDKLGSTSTMNELARSGGFSDKLTYNLINASGRALTSAAINGGDLQGALRAALLGGLVDTAHGQAASLISQATADYLSHKLAHALAGCMAGAAAGGACRDGAIGGAVGEVVAEMFKGQRPGAFAPDSEKQAFNNRVLAYSKLVSGAVAAYAGGNAQTAITTSEVAVANNFLTYDRQSSRASQWGSFKRELDSCKASAGCDVNAVYSRWTAISGEQQRQAMGSMDALFAANPSEASAAGQWFGRAVSALYMDPRDVCAASDSRCISFVQGQQNQARAVYASGWALAYANDFVDGGGRIRSSLLEAPAGGAKVVTALAQQQARNAELQALFDKNNPSNSVSLGRTSVTLIDTNSTGTTKLMNTAGFSDAALQKEVFEYAQQLAGGRPITPHATAPGIWNAVLEDGTKINVRNVSSSGAGRWTVEVQNGDVFRSLVKRDRVEVKFQ